MTFQQLQLSKNILRSLSEQNYEQPTEIQAKAIPVGLSGRDILGGAQTGTGKTAAFALPIIQNLLEGGSGHKKTDPSAGGHPDQGTGLTDRREFHRIRPVHISSYQSSLVVYRRPLRCKPLKEEWMF